MKKILILLLCMFVTYNVFANCKSNIECDKQNVTTCESCEKNLKNHYFSLQDLIIDNEQLYLRLYEDVMPICAMYMDDNGYFIKTWIDSESDYCPSCGYRTWNQTLGCCLNPPSRCQWSCQNR